MVFLGSVLYIVGLILTDISYTLGRSARAAAVMPFKIVILWTDALVFLLLRRSLGLVWHVRRHEHLRGAVAQGRAQSPAAMAAAIVLAVFVIDRIARFAALSARRSRCRGRQSQSTRSKCCRVFDTLDGPPASTRRQRPIRRRWPRTPTPRRRSSCRMAGRSRDFPRLKYRRRAPQEPGDRLGARRCPARFLRAGRGAGGLAVPLPRCSARCWRIGRQRIPTGCWRAIWRGETDVPWRAMLLTLAVMLAVGSPVVVLSAIPRARHRQGRTGRVLPGAEEHPHRAGHRHPDDAGDAAVRACCSASWPAISAAGWTTSSSTSTPR